MVKRPSIPTPESAATASSLRAAPVDKSPGLESNVATRCTTRPQTLQMGPCLWIAYAFLSAARTLSDVKGTVRRRIPSAS
jgi:hypothetical protein